MFWSIRRELSWPAWRHRTTTRICSSARKHLLVCCTTSPWSSLPRRASCHSWLLEGNRQHGPGFVIRAACGGSDTTSTARKYHISRTSAISFREVFLSVRESPTKAEAMSSRLCRGMLYAGRCPQPLPSSLALLTTDDFCTAFSIVNSQSRIYDPMCDSFRVRVNGLGQPIPCAA